MTATAERPVAERLRTSDDFARCAVVVVNYGSHALLEHNLLPLHRQDPGLQIVVVDNFTDDTERRCVQQLGAAYGWTVIAEPGNRGFAAGVNRGAHWAFEHGAEHVLLLNPDASISAADLRILRRRVTEDELTMVAPVVRTPQGHLWFGGSCVDITTGAVRSTYRSSTLRPREVPWLSGACLLVSRELWRKVGDFDERYFLYWEDIDFSYRVQQAGGSVAVVGEASAVHEQGGTQRARTAAAKSDTYYYQMVRNRLLFARAHLGPAARSRWVANAPKYAWRVVLHGGRRQLLHSVRPILAAGNGIRDGVAGRQRAGSTALVVLQSVPDPLPTTNPYNVMLADALDADPALDVRMFSWREALLHHHDVFHAHWPETLVEDRGSVKTSVRRALFALLLIKWRLAGTAVVRTVHNLELPTGITDFERFLLLQLERSTVGRITLNPFTPIEASGPARTVLHGHYRPWFAGHELPDPIPGRLAYFGMVRRYKGLDTLIRAFHEIDEDRDLSLSVAGRPSNTQLATELVRQAHADPRIEFSFDFLDTAQLVAHIGRAELIVLPHTGMHNSGSVLAALSLNRPVLVQDNDVNRWLAREVGDGWVQLYAGTLTAESLTGAVERLRTTPRSASPDLSSRDWSRVAQLHLEVFRESVQERRDRRATAAGGSNGR